MCGWRNQNASPIIRWQAQELLAPSAPWLPEEKLTRLQSTVAERKELPSMKYLFTGGTVAACSQVSTGGENHLYSTASRVKEPHFYVRLNASFQSDLWWWHTFLRSWNGISLLHWHSPNSFNISIQMDASGSWGCRAIFVRKWLQWQWPPSWAPLGIMVKELIPILLSCAIWGPLFAKCTVLLNVTTLVWLLQSIRVHQRRSW